jgi:hypothetical protein
MSFKPLTKEYLLKRGSCCNNNCKNCPYKIKQKMELKTVMRPIDSENELIKFCEYIKKYVGEYPIIVEIGSFMGESAEIFAKSFPKGKIYCIDPWIENFDEKDAASHADYKEVEQQFDLRTKNYNNIVKIKNYSTNVSLDCDLVYIDGRHFYEGVKEDILHWLPLTKKVISGHDYYNDEIDKIQPHTAGVRKAVNEILGTPEKIFNDGSWVIKL